MRNYEKQLEAFGEDPSTSYHRPSTSLYLQFVMNTSMTTTTSVHNFERQNAAYSAAVSRDSIPQLYNFSTALTILRIAWNMGELDASVVDLQYCGGGGGTTTTTTTTNGSSDSDSGSGSDSAIQFAKEQLLTDFYAKLDQIERTITDTTSSSHSTKIQPTPTNAQSFIVTVEGLDGSGKSSLVQGLVDALNHTANVNNDNNKVVAVQMATPTASMATVRPIFDQRGGPVARAFYMVSNYVLQHDIQQLEKQSSQQLVIVVDRWYTSTVAYSLGWKNTHGGTEAVDALEARFFTWPHDLRAPDLLFLLQVDHAIRQERVRHRNRKVEQSQQQSNFNPWDARLNQDVQLGCRIMRALERVAQEGLSTRTTHTIHLNANPTQDQVLQNAVEVVQQQLATKVQQLHPLETFATKPLQYFTWVSSQLQLCHFETGRRLKHAPWAMQLAWNSDASGGPPVLKTVGIHSTTAVGILCFMRNNPSSTVNNNSKLIHASMVWCGGEYPYEQQWRAEGFLLPIGHPECEFMDTNPPPSLVAYTVACQRVEQNNIFNLHETAQALRANPPPRSEQEQALQGMRFVPLVMELVVGGPSSPGGPQRFEWKRGTVTCEEAGTNTDNHGWSRARPILPFRGPHLQPRRSVREHLRPMTVAITGTHCAGKASLGTLVAQILGWSFQGELGEILRNLPSLAAGGHRVGDGSGQTNAKSWDDQVWEAEVARDAKSEGSRLVETHHIGNLAWAMLRVHNNNKKDTLSADHQQSLSDLHMERAKSAIRQEIVDRQHVVLVVHLSIDAQDSVRRRHSHTANTDRIPMADEVTECTELHHYLDVCTKSYIQTLQKELSFPCLILDNSQDDESSMKAAGQKIVEFVNEQQWRRAVY